MEELKEWNDAYEIFWPLQIKKKHILLRKRQKRDLEFSATIKAAYPVFTNTLFSTYGSDSGTLNTYAQLVTTLATFTSSEKSQFCSYINTYGVSDLSNFVCHTANEYLAGRKFPSLSG